LKHIGQMNKFVEAQFVNCALLDQPKCQTWYSHHRKEITDCLEEYKEHIPVVFVSDMPELNQNIYADIINHDCFMGICFECCYPLVQFYGCEDDTDLLQRFTTNIKKSSLCYN
jgi:hypothetical protein